MNTLSLEWGNSSDEKGEVFTKPSIVSYMLGTIQASEAFFDPNSRLLEPSCGQGEFVIALTKQLSKHLESLRTPIPAKSLMGKVYAFDISEANIRIAKKKVTSELSKLFSYDDAAEIANSWFYCQDFLLWEPNTLFSHVVGNPPYVRIENIPPELLTEYRSRFNTMTDRADIYVAFYEKALNLLEKNGKLIFICTDRWMKNRYGRNLRNLIQSSYNLSLIIDLYGQKAFQADVLTYPAITLIEKSKQGPTLIIHDTDIDKISVEETVLAIKAKKSCTFGSFRNDIIKKDFPWLLGGSDEVNLIRKLESKYPTLEESGCDVYIGVATGNNKVFMIDNGNLVEESRRVPVITASDIRSGKLNYSGKFIINTYDENGVISLSDYPLLKDYLNQHFDVLSKRHVAKKTPHYWYKTIDRLYTARANREKLLIPDIKSTLTVVHDDQGLQPNNSIYYVFSKEWNLRALKFILESGIGQLFVENYSTKVSGGNLRFQAQHLRRIRLPKWSTLGEQLQSELIKASTKQECDTASLISRVYDLSVKDLQILGLL